MAATVSDPETILRGLRRAWFPVARVRDLDSPQLTVLLGEELVAFRTAGGGFGMLPNRCPHRGAGLAGGQVKGDAIMCPYHGWEWNAADGRCTRIPSLASQDQIPSNVSTRPLPAEERWGWLWTCLDEPLDPIPLPDAVDGIAWQYGHGRPLPVGAGVAAATENFRDVAHFPFVHRVTMGELPQVVEPLNVRREGSQVWLEREYITQGGTGSAIWERAEPFTFRYHLVAPSFVCLEMDYGRGGKRILLNVTTPHGYESSTIYWAEGITPDFDGPSLDEVLALEAQVYDEDVPILDSLRPREIPFFGEAVEFSTPSDRYTLAYRRAFLDFVSRATQPPSGNGVTVDVASVAGAG